MFKLNDIPKPMCTYVSTDRNSEKPSSICGNFMLENKAGFIIIHQLRAFDVSVAFRLFSEHFFSSFRGAVQNNLHS